MSYTEEELDEFEFDEQFENQYDKKDILNIITTMSDEDIEWIKKEINKLVN